MNASALPIMELRYGGLSYEGQQGFHTLGKLICKGKTDFSEASSCSALKRSGQFKSGYYNIEAEGGYSKLVHCDMSLPGYNDDNSQHSVIDEKVASLDDKLKDLETFKIDGKYCIMANGPCPTGFSRHEGHNKAIEVYKTSSDWLKEVSFGDSRMIRCRGCANNFPDNEWLELTLHVCCKD